MVVLGKTVTFTSSTTATLTGTAAAAAINADSSLSSYVTASAASGVVTLTYNSALANVTEVTYAGTANTAVIATSTAGAIAVSAGGTDALTGGTGLDTFVFAAGSSVATIGGSADAGTITLFDTITDFSIGTASANSETLNVGGTGAVASVTAGTDGIDSALTIGAATIKSHAIASTGLVTFDDAATFATALTIDSSAKVAAAIQYLTLNDIGTIGTSVMFTDGTNSYVYTQSLDGGLAGDVVQLVGVLGLSLSATNANTAGLVFIS